VVVLRRGEGTLLITPETGSATRVAMPEAFESGTILEPGRTPLRTPDGRRIFLLCRDHRLETPPGPYRSLWVREDGDAFVATAALDSCVTFLGCPTDDSVIVHDGRAIYRLRFGSDAREEIWRAR
jgi:hypothetical protein